MGYNNLKKRKLTRYQYQLFNYDNINIKKEAKWRQKETNERGSNELGQKCTEENYYGFCPGCYCMTGASFYVQVRYSFFLQRLIFNFDKKKKTENFKNSTFLNLPLYKTLVKTRINFKITDTVKAPAVDFLRPITLRGLKIALVFNP